MSQQIITDFRAAEHWLHTLILDRTGAHYSQARLPRSWRKLESAPGIMSPYLQVSREKLCLNGQRISATEFIERSSLDGVAANATTRAPRRPRAGTRC